MLKHRIASEVAAEQALALALTEYNRRLASLENTRRQLAEALEAAQKGEPDLFEMRQLLLYGTSLNKKINVQEKDVISARQTVELKRDRVVQARQGRRAMEKLKEHCLQNYRREMASREQKEIDELSLNAYRRRINRQLPPRLV